jgi:hypothetical protein
MKLCILEFGAGYRACLEEEVFFGGKKADLMKLSKFPFEQEAAECTDRIREGRQSNICSECSVRLHGTVMSEEPRRP